MREPVLFYQKCYDLFLQGITETELYCAIYFRNQEQFRARSDVFPQLVKVKIKKNGTGIAYDVICEDGKKAKHPNFSPLVFDTLEDAQKWYKKAIEDDIFLLKKELEEYTNKKQNFIKSLEKRINNL